LINRRPACTPIRAGDDPDAEIELWVPIVP
jgi:hypothetical protein